MYLGWALTYVGAPDEGLATMRRAFDRNPFPPGWYWLDIGWAHFVAGRYQDAIAALERRSPKSIGTRELLALCHAMLGQDDEAAAHMRAVMEARPNMTVKRAARIEPFRDETDLRHYLDALRAAGVPEGTGSAEAL